MIAYGSTLLVAVFTPEFAVFTQIGEGKLSRCGPTGSPFPRSGRRQPGRVADHQPVPAGRGGGFPDGSRALADNPLFAVLLATDGFGNAQADDPWPPGFALDLVQLGRDHQPGWFASQLPGWAEQCASVDGSGDDSTMALVVSSTVRPGPGLQPQEAKPAFPHGTGADD